jgi:hypothetical protein
VALSIHQFKINSDQHCKLKTVKDKKKSNYKPNKPTQDTPNTLVILNVFKMEQICMTYQVKLRYSLSNNEITFEDPVSIS